MNPHKTFDEYQEEYRRSIAQRDREDEELLMKLTSEANDYKADLDNKTKANNKKAYEDSKRKQIELYENLSSTSDLKTWERILNMCDVEHPPENVDLSTFVDVMKKMDSRIIEKPEPVAIKKGDVHFDDDAPSPISASGSKSNPDSGIVEKKKEKGDDLFDFVDDDDDDDDNGANYQKDNNDDETSEDQHKEESETKEEAKEELGNVENFNEGNDILTHSPQEVDTNAEPLIQTEEPNNQNNAFFDDTDENDEDHFEENKVETQPQMENVEEGTYGQPMEAQIGLEQENNGFDNIL